MSSTLAKGGFPQSTLAPHQKHSSSQIYLSVEHLNRLVSMHLANTESCLVREACPCSQSIDKYRLESQGRRCSRVRVETSHFLNNTDVLQICPQKNTLRKGKQLINLSNWNEDLGLHKHNSDRSSSFVPIEVQDEESN